MLKTLNNARVSGSGLAILFAAGALAPLTACNETPATKPETSASAQQFVTSADGTKIAYDRVGTGPALIIVGGMLSDRRGSEGLAKALSPDFTVYIFDRRGRGESGDTAPYAVKREVEDIAALQKIAGADTVLYGHSSGAGLALTAAASGMPLRALILHEPPFGSSDAESRKQSAEAALKVRDFIAADRRKEAVESFLTYAKAPPEAVRQAASNPETLRMAPSMLYDLDVMNTDGGSLLPEAQVRAMKAKTIVLVGSKAPPPFRDAGKRIAEITGGQFQVLEGQEHNADPAVVAGAIGKALRPE